MTFLWDLNPNMTCTKTRIDPLAEALCDVLEALANRGRIQAQGKNPPVQKSVPWSQSTVPTKFDGLRWIEQVWNSLTPSQQRERLQAYEDAKQYILDSPPEGRPFNGRGGKSFYDPQRRDPSARIDIEVITGLAFRDEESP